MNLKNLRVLLLVIASPLVLIASPQTDRKIEDAAKASYNFRTVLEDHVSVKAHDGLVTLSGTVDDNSEKDLAADTVENLPGVTGVKNNIVVESSYPKYSDTWIAFKIRSLLLVKANVSATTTKVLVKDGVVTLTGTADNVAQKDLTAIYAKEIDNVKAVKNDIVVTDSPSAKDTMADTIDDASITSQVKFALLSDGATSAIKTKVTTNDGIVTVSGIAASDAERSLVSKLASDVRGVRSVTNNMTVKD